jgi:sulfatase maturation enzyme AslB (radical SAM superfamily)
MANSFCRLLSNGYKINVDWNNQLIWSPCCFYTKKTPLLDKEKFKKELEYTSSATTWLPECNTCQLMEASGVPGLSPRQNSFKKISQDAVDGQCIALEINVDLLCNAACLSCGSYASSTWKKYEYKNKLPSYGYDSKQDDTAFNQLIENLDLSQVQYLHILGGEPLYSDVHLKILRHLHKIHPALDQVRLEYHSNGSISPTAEAIELWKSFKIVNFGLSIDGVGKRFNYLRWPLKWHRIEKNLDFFLTNTNVGFNISATINPLSVWYFDEIENWVLENIPKDRLSDADWHPVRPNRCMTPLDLNLTTAELRTAIMQKYGVDHKLSKIFGNLEYRRNYQQMFDYINQHDKIRRLNWQETFPESAHFYKNFIILP